MAKNASIQDVKDNVNYAWYVTKHKANIVKPMMQMGLPIGLALKHDLSKYSPAEFPVYRDWFVGPKGLHGTQDPALHAEWRKAVEHHYTSPNNLHHWAKKDPEHPENYPLNNRLEAVADWYSVNKTNRPKGTDMPSFKDWYSERKDKLPVDIFAKKELERRLGLTKAGSIMEKTAGPRLLGAAIGAVGGGVMGSSMKDQQGNSTIGTIGGAVTGGILGGLAGNAFGGKAAKTVAKSSGKTSTRVSTSVKNMNNKKVSATPTFMDRLKQKITDSNTFVNTGEKQPGMFNNPYTNKPKRISGNSQIINSKGTKSEVMPNKRKAAKSSAYSPILPGPVSNTMNQNARLNPAFSIKP